jgi:allophanate hydrolase subunit 1
MQAHTLETTATQYKFAAMQNARMRNYANASLYTDAVKIRAERIKLLLEMLYSATNVYINYRKTKIAIKVADAQIKDRKQLRAIEAEWAANGITKTISAQGVIYSFK